MVLRRIRPFVIASIALVCIAPFNAQAQKNILSKKVFDSALLCEKNHPSAFYLKAGEFYRDGDMYDAAFLFYLGQLRYKYYVATNPEVTEDGDKAILASLNSVLGSEINDFLGDHTDEQVIMIDTVLA